MSDRNQTFHRVGLGAAVMLAALWAGATLPGCGSGSSQADARDRATAASCDWLAMCDQIGAGKKYETRDMCDVQVRASWDSAWPVATCEGKIDENQLEICLAAIKITDCKNVVDVYNTLANKCPAAKICSGGNPDGG
jgi:hypothetical protein